MSGTRAVSLNVVRTLPDGVYSGLWGGFKVEVTHEGEKYFLETEIAMKGFDVPVSIMVSSVGISVVPIK